MKILNSFKLKAAVIAIALVAVVIPATSNAAMLYRQLELGMRGSDVSDLQIFLALDATIYPQGLVTGYFGSLTKAAVMAFQARNGIAMVGRVGPITMAAINAQMNSDIDAPTISSLNLNPTNSSVAVNWYTSEGSSAKIFYSNLPIALAESNGTSPVGISGASVVVNSDLSTSHTGFVTGLQSNTVYYYVVYVKDGAGNETITWPSTFRTL